MINAGCFDLMKPSAYLINVARGPVVHQPDLIKAINGGRMAGAALDVFDPEPPPDDDPVLKLDKDKVILTPHAIGFTDQIVTGMVGLAIQSMLEVKAGKVPYGIVNTPIVDNAAWRAKLKDYAAGKYGP